MIDTETDWVASRRPMTDVPDTRSTAAVRRAVLEGGEARRHRRAPARRRRVAAVLVPASVLAAVAVFVTGTDGGAPGHGPAGVTSAEAALPALAQRLHERPDLGGGDATLVVREQSYPGTGKAPITVYDLYADDGKYFFGRSRDALPAAIAAGPERGTGSIGREVEAAAAAFQGDIATARKRMIDSVLEPGTRIKPQAAEQRNDRAWQDNWVWGNSLDALIAGAGRPDVRAGVLHLLDSVDGVTVSRITVDGRQALRLRGAVFEAGYAEELTIDADSGIPLQFVGGTADAPSAVIHYRVSRVTLDQLAG